MSYSKKKKKLNSPSKYWSMLTIFGGLQSGINMYVCIYIYSTDLSLFPFPCVLQKDSRCSCVLFLFWFSRFVLFCFVFRGMHSLFLLSIRLARCCHIYGTLSDKRQMRTFVIGTTSWQLAASGDATGSCRRWRFVDIEASREGSERFPQCHRVCKCKQLYRINNLYTIVSVYNKVLLI